MCVALGSWGPRSSKVTPDDKISDLLVCVCFGGVGGWATEEKKIFEN